DGVAVAGGLVALKFEAHEPSLRVFIALEQRLAADEVLLVRERDREADPGLERIDLIGELVAGEDQARLDPQHVERLEPERLDPARLAGCVYGVPHRRSVTRVAEHLVAELTRVPGARD